MPVVRINAEKDARCTQSVVQLQGDTRTTMVRFIVNRYDGGVDLAGLVWLIKTTNAAGVPDAWEPEMVENAGEKIVIDWLIQGSVNDADGLTEYELNGLGYEADGKAIKWVGGKGTVSVRKSYHPTFGDDADGFSNLEKLIIYVNGELQDTVAAVERAEAAATAAAEAAADSIWTSKPQGLSFGQQLQAQENIGLLEVVKNLTEPVEAEGNPVTAELVGGMPFDSVETMLELRQAGSGDPSPSNVRPISGWTGAKLTRAGKNLFDSKLFPASNNNGITFSQNADDGINIKGTATAYANTFVDIAGILPPGTYSISSKALKGNEAYVTYVRQIYADGREVTTMHWNSFVVDGSETKLYVFLQVNPNTVHDRTAYVQIEKGSTATEYEPYAGENFAVDFGQTVYGGSVDWQTGELVIDRAGVVLDGSEEWNLEYENSWYTAKQYQDCVSGPVKVVSSMFPCKQTGHADTGNNIYISSSKRINVQTDAVAHTVDAFKALLAANPLTVVYPITTPIIIQLTPWQIKQLEGMNTLYGDGAISIAGRQDPRKAILSRIEALREKYSE